MANGWTDERKARQANAITRWKPWQQSTGPRTAEGKARVARNAYRGGARPTLRALAKELNALMREQRSSATGDILAEAGNTCAFKGAGQAPNCS